MTPLDRDTVFVALTRPQMFGGVTYSFFIVNAIVTTEAFLLFKSAWVIVLALWIHLVGYLACLKEPRFLDLWLVRTSRCQRIPNYRYWQCNSYQP
jgi:type IV secretion system protein VirB3